MIRTLVVEDDFRVARIHTAYVEKVSGFEVVGEAHNAATAVDLVDSLRPDLLLLDLYLPDEHGLDLAAGLRLGDHPPVDVIVITAARDLDSVRAALQHGALHYILKPFTFDSFRDKLVSYATMRSRLGDPGEADQFQVDRVFGALRTEPVGPTPKGRSPLTLEKVEKALSDSVEGVTALRVAEHTGMSRATAQRYLSYLESTGRVSVHLRYGTTGRPEHIYRWGPP